jgi:hypothetical protein
MPFWAEAVKLAVIIPTTLKRREESKFRTVIVLVLE